MTGKLALGDLPDGELAAKRALVRVDYNVPFEHGEIGDDARIRATLPTLGRVLDAGGSVVLLSHLGRPGGKEVPELSLRPVAARLSQLLGREVNFLAATVGPEAEEAAGALAPGQALLLENSRFLPGEEKNDPKTARKMAKLGDIFVNDAFGAAHRAHASTAGVAGVMREEGKKAAAGLLMERELRYLGSALADPERPFIAVLGGAKISGKIEVVRALLPRVDLVVIGGAMANTFFRALGLQTGRSLVEEELVPFARELLDQGGDKLLLPADVRVAAGVEAGAKTKVVAREEIPRDWSAVDIGTDTERRYRELLESARTIFWNGPMGVFETPEFAVGTEAVARAIVRATERGATTVAGGGDSAAALAEFGWENRVSHLSTGGGAALQFLEGKVLPGVAALSDLPESTGG
ncbi:MAG: phosphoglycerate kinase [Longimicrobiaceae bacterium]